MTDKKFYGKIAYGFDGDNTKKKSGKIVWKAPKILDHRTTEMKNKGNNKF